MCIFDIYTSDVHRFDKYPRGVYPGTLGGYMSLPEADKKKLLTRMRRAEGQLRAIARMIEDDTPCADTLVQVSAIQGALGKIGELILAEHIESCVADAFKHGDETQRQQTIDDLMDVFSRYGAR